MQISNTIWRLHDQNAGKNIQHIGNLKMLELFTLLQNLIQNENKIFVCGPDKK